MSRTLFIAFTVAFSLGCAAKADESQKKSIDALQAAENYTRGLSGFAGHQLEADNEFERILASENAESVFLEIIHSVKSTPAAVAYSFCGLKKLGSDKVDLLEKALSANENQVSQMHGDVLKKETLSKVMRSIYENGC